MTYYWKSSIQYVQELQMLLFFFCCHFDKFESKFTHRSLIAKYSYSFGGELCSVLKSLSIFKLFHFISFTPLLYLNSTEGGRQLNGVTPITHSHFERCIEKIILESQRCKYQWLFCKYYWNWTHQKCY